MKTILVVDDEPLVVTLVSRVLKDAGYGVISTSEPAEALSICRDAGAQIDLLLTDLMMPVMNGRELHAQVAQVRPYLPVSYMSGYADSRAREMMGGDAQHVLLKPFGVASLLSAVNKGIEYRPSIAPPELSSKNAAA